MSRLDKAAEKIFSGEFHGTVSTPFTKTWARGHLVEIPSGCEKVPDYILPSCYSGGETSERDAP
jgi:hypothetical protein